jgi:hypothetical protein
VKKRNGLKKENSVNALFKLVSTMPGTIVYFQGHHSKMDVNDCPEMQERIARLSVSKRVVVDIFTQSELHVNEDENILYWLHMQANNLLEFFSSIDATVLSEEIEIFFFKKRDENHEERIKELIQEIEARTKVKKIDNNPHDLMILL